MPVVTGLALMALAFGAGLFRARGALRWGLWVFVAATVLSWAVMPRDLIGLRHFAGIALGVVSMAIVPLWCTTRERLLDGLCLVVLAAIGILSVGLAGTSVYTGKSSALNHVLSVPIVPETPRVKLALPGLEKTGEVNANGLAGTALMVLPGCAALTAISLVSGGRRRVFVVVGVLGTLLAIGVLGVTLSRTALIGSVVTTAILGLRWRPGRKWIFVLLIVSTAVLAAATTRARAANPQHFEYALGVTKQVAGVRIAVWRKAVDRLRESPWLGVGINQFHDVSPVTTGYYGTTHVAHAHNAFLQVALDVGLPGFAGYAMLFGIVLVLADRAARTPGTPGLVAAGAGLSLVAVHAFGVADAIALGAKVGLFQWLFAGLIVAATQLGSSRSLNQIERPSVQFS